MIDQAREELEIEAQSAFDYVQEAYHGMTDDPITLRYEEQDRWECDMIDAQDATEARGGPAFHATYLDDLPF